MKRNFGYLLSILIILTLSACFREKNITLRTLYPGDINAVTLIQVISYEDNRMISISDPDAINKWIKKTDAISLTVEEEKSAEWFANPQYLLRFREGTSMSFTFRYKELQGVFNEIKDGQAHSTLFSGKKNLLDSLTPLFLLPAKDSQLVESTRPDVAPIYEFVKLSNQGEYEKAADFLSNGKDNPNYINSPEQSLLRNKEIVRVWDKSDRPDGHFLMNEDVPYWESRTFLVEYIGDWKEKPRDAYPIEAPRYDVYTLFRAVKSSPWLIYNITSGSPEWIN